jgi:hypothetical protein
MNDPEMAEDIETQGTGKMNEDWMKQTKKIAGDDKLHASIANMKAGKGQDRDEGVDR